MFYIWVVFLIGFLDQTIFLFFIFWDRRFSNSFFVFLKWKIRIYFQNNSEKDLNGDFLTILWLHLIVQKSSSRQVFLTSKSTRVVVKPRREEARDGDRNEGLVQWKREHLAINYLVWLDEAQARRHKCGHLRDNVSIPHLCSFKSVVARSSIWRSGGSAASLSK